MKVSKSGFTLVEIMVVVAIIGLLVAIAIPNFIVAGRMARQNACIANMKQIEGAVEIWAAEHNRANGDIPALSDLVPDYIRTWPSCGNMSYEIPPVGTDPSCPQGIADHKL